MKSRAGYVLAALCLLVGITIAGALVWSQFVALGSAFIRVVVPGTAELTLDQPGSYTIYLETQSVVDGRLYSVENIGSLSVTVTADGDGKAIPVTAPGMTESYTIGGHKGVSVFAFEIAGPGRYRLTAGYPGGRSGPQTVLAVGRGFVWGLIGTIFGAIAAVLAGFGAALALVLTTYFRRRRLLQASLPARPQRL